MRHLIIFFLFSSDLAVGQNLVLRVFNPAPRFGQEILVSVRITDYYHPLDSIDGDQERDLGEGQIKFNSWALDTGTMHIGPFTLVVNGVVYKSDSIHLKIDQPLPAETLGLWIRQITFRQRDYLIVEQRIPGEWRKLKTTKKNEFGSRFSSEGEFGELDIDSFDPSQIRLSLTFSTSKIEAAGQRFRGGNADTTYKVYVYEVTKGPKFSGGYQIKRSQFNKLPNEIKFDRWTIK